MKVKQGSLYLVRLKDTNVCILLFFFIVYFHRATVLHNYDALTVTLHN